MDGNRRWNSRGARTVVVGAPCRNLRAAIGMASCQRRHHAAVYPLLFFAVVNSAVVTLRRGGVRWRETFYSLDTLRKGNVQ